MIQLVDRLIQRGAREHATTDELRAMRVLAGISAYMLVPTLAMMSSFWVVGGLVAALPCFVALCALGWILVRLKATGSRRYSGRALWSTLYCLSVFSALHEGGFTGFLSPTIPFIVMLALYLENVREGFIAAGLSAVAMPIIFWLQEHGYTLPSLLPGQNPLPTQVIAATLSTLAFAFLAWANDTSRRTAFDELGRALEKVKTSDAARERAETELRLAQKLESVGRLAAGMAHEINTPLQFAGDSMRFVSEAVTDLVTVVKAYSDVAEAAERGPVPAGLTRALMNAKSDADLDYIVPELPIATERALDGIGRVNQIVRSMKEFAHPDRKEKALADLNRAIQSTLTIARSEYKEVADVELLLGDIPRVSCQLGEVNQVILNLVINAAHAIADKNKGTSRRGRISVKTVQEGGQVLISIGDDGSGIPSKIRGLIYDPFFTTKEVGRGTGQGLAIARSIIVNQHGGSLTFETKEGVGTTFYARLPA